MSTTIYYFSGSGNSLHAARELRQRLPDADLVPMVRLLSVERIESHGETVGFVFPIHGMTLPIPVRRFIGRLDPSSAQYLFAVATRAATPHRAFSETDRMLRKRGRRLDAFFTLTMPSNDRSSGTGGRPRTMTWHGWRPISGPAWTPSGSSSYSGRRVVSPTRIFSSRYTPCSSASSC